MSAAQLHADVHETIAPWRQNGTRPHTVWRLLTGVVDYDASWFRVEQYMTAWLASREAPQYLSGYNPLAGQQPT